MMRKYHFLYLIIIGIISCTSHTSDKMLSDTNTADTFKDSREIQAILGKDSSSIRKRELTKIYSLAITDFIKEANKKNNQKFDTLFFGKHVYGQPDDFPDIKLPDKIENTVIRVISPGAGEKIQRERKSVVYINLIGWIEPVKAEFIFVTFSNGGQHAFDFFSDYVFNTGLKKIEHLSSRFEDYIYNDDGSLSRIAVFIDGKFIKDKESE